MNSFYLRLIVCAALLLIVCGCGKKPDGSLLCDGDSTGRYCVLRPGAKYLGFFIGMDQHAAFQNLCKSSNASNFREAASMFDPDDLRQGAAVGPGFSYQGKVCCSVWGVMKQSYAWSVKSRNGTCLFNSDELIVLKFQKNKLSYLSAGCATLVI